MKIRKIGVILLLIVTMVLITYLIFNKDNEDNDIVFETNYIEPSTENLNLNNIPNSDFTYFRAGAIDYAINWTSNEYEKQNRIYGRYRYDCTAFLSQVLVNGDLNMNDNFYFERKDEYDEYEPIYKRDQYTSKSWVLAQDQYEYIANINNGYAKGVIIINTIEELYDVINNQLVKKGDLLYWDYNYNDIMDHATIITNINSEDIYYTGHSPDVVNYSLIDALSGEYKGSILYIVLMK